MKARNARIGLAVVLVLALVGGIVVAVRSLSKMDRTHIVAYFDNTTAYFAATRSASLVYRSVPLTRSNPSPTG